MQINTDTQEFGDPVDIRGNRAEQLAQELELLDEAQSKGHVVAIGDKDHLMSLQDSLRKAGYRKAR